ncbi:N-acetylmuramoyl-L-alanine amidase family protein [Breznakiella homolactica]|uniref:N-acetylmuramoyl-L-alanine amidase n=1 Tax=Breznakiella homolactica TaxID=2798577 RepID=A0A7T7XLF1_9SPIR|nr:N-acetylmuramoyl-L-alanine amidase [Breznakiella homolactica]QQO08408.1 N-acetylmuramoyl-L-alanine amidase [Breznakiella homolactica]
MDRRDFHRTLHTVFFILLLTPGAVLHAQQPSSMPLDDALKSLGAALRWNPFFQAGVIEAGNHRAAFETGPRGSEALVLVDGRDVLTLPSPYVEKGLLYFPEAFVASLKAVLDTAARDDRDRYRIAAIIVDPGHGGKDSGAIGTHTINGKQLRLQEKDITLSVSKDLHSRLAAAYPDKRVLLTREGDTYPTLEDRVSIAHSVPLKDNEAIVFVSVHANASFNKNARGYEVWYLSPEYRRTVIDKDKYTDAAEVLSILNDMLEEEYTTESIMMAQFIMNRFDQSIGSQSPSRGIKAEEWFVVRNARMPSVLIELGFVTNPEDAKLMADGAYLKKLSEAIYNGIVDFVTMFEQSGGFTQIQ